MAFNAIVAKLFWLGEVTGLNANNAKAWHETFGKLYWELSVTAIGCSAKGPGSWEISADGCISAVAFNAIVAKLFVLLKLRAQMQTMRRHGVKLSVLKMLGLLPQEIEPNMTIHQMGR